MKDAVPVSTLAVFLILMASTATARTFQNGYISFDIPDDWKCALEDLDWVCQRQDPAVARESIIVIAAKQRGDADTLQNYLAYLKEQKKATNPDGSARVSRVLLSELRTINGHSWVVAVHDESELPGFRTRYCGTVMGDLGVLATFSVRSNLYDQYLPQFEAMLMSLQATRGAGLQPSKASPAATPTATDPSGPAHEPGVAARSADEAGPTGKKASGCGCGSVGGVSAIALAALGAWWGARTGPRKRGA